MNQKQIDELLDLIFDSLDPGYDDSGYFVGTGNAQDTVIEEYPELDVKKTNKLERVLEIIRDNVEVSHSKSKEETGWVDDFEYSLDEKSENKIKEILKT